MAEEDGASGSAYLCGEFKKTAGKDRFSAENEGDTEKNLGSI